jgi:hypothetical protein
MLGIPNGSHGNEREQRIGPSIVIVAPLYSSSARALKSRNGGSDWTHSSQT